MNRRVTGPASDGVFPMADVRYFETGSGVGAVGVNGSGLMILSRYPIVETMYKRFAVNGKFYRGKGHPIIPPWTGVICWGSAKAGS
jgi:hypothetical protein